MENNDHDDMMKPAGSEDDTLLARWLAGELSPEDLEALRNLEGYPDYVEMLHALEGMELPEFSPTLAWQKLQSGLEAEKAAISSSSAEASEQLEPIRPGITHPVEANEAAPTPLPEAPKQPEVGSSQSAVSSQGAAQTDVVKQDALAPLPEAPKQPEAKIVEINQPRISNADPNRKSSILNRKYLAIAATFLLAVVGIWWFASRDQFSFTDTDYVTKAGETKEVKLPDGSVATLNAVSKLGFTASDWTDARTVALEGEAYFKAKKGKTFSVRTEQGTVEVVGTVFNVFARGEELEVKCAEGKVQVINPEGTERVLLKKGEQVSILGGKMQKRQGLAFYPNWFKGESAFRTAPLEKVFGEMERQYGVVVLADSLGERTFSGKFVHDDLQKAVKMVCAPMKLNCEVRGDTVWVK